MLTFERLLSQGGQSYMAHACTRCMGGAAAATQQPRANACATTGLRSFQRTRQRAVLPSTTGGTAVGNSPLMRLAQPGKQQQLPWATVSAETAPAAVAALPRKHLTLPPNTNRAALVSPIPADPLTATPPSAAHGGIKSASLASSSLQGHTSSVRYNSIKMRRSAWEEFEGDHMLLPQPSRPHF